MGTHESIKNHAEFIWSVADLLRGDYKQSEYGRVILPLTVLRRLDCVLEPTKQATLERHAALKDRLTDVAPALEQVTGVPFYNTHRLTLRGVLADATNAADHLRAYVAAFSPRVFDVLAKFDLDAQITRLDRAGLLYLVLGKFCDVDLHPDAVSNHEMGYLYEELIRKFSELSNETAGEHFTPREVIRLMVELLFADEAQLATPGIRRSLLDPACGTGGMLTCAQDRVHEYNAHAVLDVFGQELNEESYAICCSDVMMKGGDASRIAYGNSFSHDAHAGTRFDYLLANPPFGVEWKKVEKVVRDEHADRGFEGRFGAGLPRINDGSLLFVQHMIAHMKRPDEGGARLAIVFNGSPLFTGAAGSGESEIRRWIIENDWLEAIVALPDQLFYNTGISTYVWVITNRKAAARRGRVQLIDARALFEKMRKSLGDKRKMLSDAQIGQVARLHDLTDDTDQVRWFPNHAFGFMRITVERPLRLCWQVSDDTLAAVAEHPTLAKLGDEKLGELMMMLAGHEGLEGTDKRALSAALRADLAPLGLTAPQTTKLMECLSVRDPDAPVVTDAKGNPQPDPDLRDQENVPLPDLSVHFEADVTDRLARPEYRDAVDAYLRAEVLPYVPDAWVDHTKTKIGYEIPLTRHFYTYTPPRPLEEIDAELREVNRQIQELMAEMLG